MESFASLFPDLAAALASELRAMNREALVLELETARVRVVTFDQDKEFGYIAFEPSSESNVVGERPGPMIGFPGLSYAYLELSNLGHVLGVEVVAPPPDLAMALRWQASNNRWRGP